MLFPLASSDGDLFVITARVGPAVAFPPSIAAPGVVETPTIRPGSQEGNGLYCANEVRILVLDDDPSICRMVQAGLSSSAYKVDGVSDPGQVREMLHSRLFHVIILDY